MNMGENQFQAGLITLVKEAFFGIAPGKDGTWFVQGKEGIFDALATITAAQASAKPNPNSPTIAAHAFHVLFALQNGNSNVGRPSPEGTWESSWEKEGVTELEWATLADQIRDEYHFFFDFVSNNDDWTDVEAATGTLAQLAHMSYHLGAVRALMQFV